jgi:2'-5' RNA ligase
MLSMRAFIAIEVPDELKAKAAKLQERLEMLDIETSIVKPENMHYNLKFLGEINEADSDKVKAVLSRIVPQHAAFDLHIAGAGAFPQVTYARVVWLGAKEGAQQLSALAEDIELALADMGFGREEKPFTPHLTLARIKSGQHKPELITVLKDMANTDIGTMHVGQVVLFQSQLTPKGPIYTPVHIVKLS